MYRQSNWSKNHITAISQLTPFMCFFWLSTNTLSMSRQLPAFWSTSTWQTSENSLPWLTHNKAAGMEPRLPKHTQPHESSNHTWAMWQGRAAGIPFWGPNVAAEMSSPVVRRWKSWHFKSTVSGVSSFTEAFTGAMWWYGLGIVSDCVASQPGSLVLPRFSELSNIP